MKKKEHDKKKQEAPQITRKQGHAIKEFVPVNMMEHLKQQSIITIPPEKIPEKNFLQYAAPNSAPPEWGEATAEDINKEISDNIDELKNTFNPFEDPEHNELESSLPLYLLQCNDGEILWDRPDTYVPNYYIDKEIKRLYPKKNFSVMRDDIRKCYYDKMRKIAAFSSDPNDDHEEEEEEDIDNYLKNDEETMKQAIYKDFYNLLEKTYKFQVVNTFERTETDDEYIKRKELEEKEKPTKKKKVKKPSQSNVNGTGQRVIEESEKLVFKEITPSRISITDFKHYPLLQNSFYSYLSSIFQMILDLDLVDCNTGKSIINNIYPQKDGVPMYNPEGKYIVKLYLMGKARKIVIDDRIPMSKDHELILPRCSHVEELWPVIFTKALLKLVMYKTRHPLYFIKEEFMDTSVLYALTGMHILELDLNSSIMKMFQNVFKLEEKEHNKEIPLEEPQEKEKPKEKAAKGKDKEKELEKEREKEKEENFILGSVEPKMYYAVYQSQRTRIMRANPNSVYQDIVERFDMIRQRTCGINPNVQKVVSINGERFVITRSRNRTGSGKEREGDKLAKEKSVLLFGSGNLTSAERTTASGQNFQRSKKKAPTIVQKKPIANLNYKKENLFSENNIIRNFLYSVNDYFNNSDFNMERLHFLDFSDLQKELTDKRVLFKQLGLHEKKKYLLARRELRKKKIEEKNKKLESLKENGIAYNLIKLTSQAIDIPELSFFHDYNETEITWAKKCLLNNWKFPPASYFNENFTKKEEEQKKLEQELALEREKKNKEDEMNIGIAMNDEKKPSKKKKLGAFAWTRELYTEFAGGEGQYNIQVKEPKVSSTVGSWMTYNDLKDNFDKVLVIYNQNKIFRNSLLVDNTWYCYKTDSFEPLEEYKTILLTPRTDGIIKNEVELNSPNQLLAIFEPYTERFGTGVPKREIIFSYISLDIVDNETNEIVCGNVILNKFYSVFSFSELDPRKVYAIHFKGGVTPTGYIFQVMSQTHTITNMSYNSYLKTFKGYSSNTFNIAFPTIEANKDYFIARIKIKRKSEEKDKEDDKEESQAHSTQKKDFITFSYTIRTAEFGIVKRYCAGYLVKEDEFNSKLRVEAEKQIKIDASEIDTKPYYLILSMRVIITLKESSFELETLCDDNTIEFEQVDLIEPYCINEKYVPNRKGIVFTYYLYPSDKITASFDIELYQILDEIKVETPVKKGAKNNNADNFNNVYIESKPLKNKYRFNLELYQLTKEPSLEFIYDSLPFSYSNQGKLVAKWDFFNHITISNLFLEGECIQPEKKKANKKDSDTSLPQQKTFPYVFLCYFDSDFEHYNLEENVGYCIRVFSSDNIAFVEDTSKVDHEKQMIENWEEKDNGRAMRASKSRKRYIIYEKIKNEEEITTEEKKEFEEERERRTSNQIDHVAEEEPQPPKAKGRDGRKRMPTLKQAKKIKLEKKENTKEKDKDKEEEKENGSNHLFDFMLKEKAFSMKNIFAAPLPKFENSKSSFILNYVNYTNKERTIINNNCSMKAKPPLIANEEYRERMKAKIIQRYEESERYYKCKVKAELENSGSELNDSLKTMTRSISVVRLNQKKRAGGLINIRNLIKDKLQKKLDVQIKMGDIMKSGTTTEKGEKQKDKNIFDFSIAMSLYKDGAAMFGEDSQICKKFFKYCSSKKEESILAELKKLGDTSKLKEKDKGNVVKLLEDINYNKWEVSEDTMNKLKALIKN